MKTPEQVSAECYSGYTFAQDPRSFVCEGQRRRVISLHRRWREPAGPCFEVLADDGRVYRLAYQEQTDAWQVSLGRQCNASGMASGHDGLHSRKEIRDDHRGTQRN